jgi:glycosyltransferase involved in cell wall biosynthesis
VRPFNFVRFLARHGHRVLLATVWETDDDRQALQHLEELGIEVLAAPLTRTAKLRNMLGALPSARPIQADFCWAPELAHRLDVALAGRRIDVVHVEHLRGARYALHVKRGMQHSAVRTPMVWDSVDSITHLFEQAARRSQSAKGKLMTRLELPRTRRFEGWLTGEFDRVLVTSPVDKAALERVSTRPAPICVVPNGVDLAHFSPVDAPRQDDSLVFSGKMSYHANITAALYLVNEIMPRVWARRPHVTLSIVGKDPTADVRSLAARHPGRVTVTGMVPDMRDHLRRASVAVVPVVYGAGIQNKVLEAMACATPVVTSDKTVHALQPGYDEALAVASDAQSFADATLRLLDDADHRRQLGAAGRRYIEANHDWDCIVDRLVAIYVAAAAARA